MRSRWKKMLFWSSMGSLAVGAAIALTRRTRVPAAPMLDYQRIPDECQRISLWTEQFGASEGNADLAVQDKYVLQVTPFKVWSVFSLSRDSSESRPEGAIVYHVTHMRYAGDAGAEGYPDEGRLQDRFYGTIAVRSPEGMSSPRNFIARGALLEIHKCLVGGASNGVETGEIHYSEAVILNYRIEYSAR